MHHHKIIMKIDTGSMIDTIDTRQMSTIDHHGTESLDDLIHVLCRIEDRLFRQRE